MCDEKLKSATWFQTSSTSVSGFCHAQLPLIQHTASLTPEKHFDRSAERHVLIGSSGGGRLKEQSAPSSPPCRLMEPQPQTSVQTVFPHGYIKQDVSRRVPADKTRYFKLKHLFLTQSRSFCAETRSDKNQTVGCNKSYLESVFCRNMYVDPGDLYLCSLFRFRGYLGGVRPCRG